MTDIREDLDVLLVFRKMGGVTLMEPKGQRIYMSIGDLAFWMMDKCIDAGLGKSFMGLCAPTAEEIINLAVKAWDSRAAQTEGDE